MGQQKSQMEQVTGTANLRINRVLNSDQLLVKICRNGKEWLSPVGWVKDEKGTLLECKIEKDSSIVEIPAEFAKKLKTGDQIVLKNLESGFESEIVWGKSPAVKSSSKTKKSNGTVPVSGLVALEETEKRAQEAEKAAANYKHKMEAAAKAREAAQAAALEAARKADEALKAEAERIAEMEQAAKAFEEAEKLRLDEQRRLDKGRRIEEERRKEEARLAEEARVKAHAERVRKERTAARKNIKSEIDKIKAEKSSLQEQLADVKSRVLSTETSLADTDKKLVRLDKSLGEARKLAADSKTVLDSEQSDVDKYTAQRSKINDTAQTIDKDNEKLAKRLEKAESVYQKAKKDTEAAKLRELEHLNGFEAVKSETKTVQTQKEALLQQSLVLKEKISTHERTIGNYKDAFTKARKIVDSEQSEVNAAKKDDERLKQELKSGKTELARNLEKIASTDAELKKRKDALLRVDDLDNADDIRLLGSGQPSASSAEPKANKLFEAEEETTGFLGKLFGRGKSSEKPTDTPVTNPTLKPKTQNVKTKPPATSATKTPTIKSELVIPKPTQDSTSPRGRLNSWLMIGAALGAVTLIGSSYAIANKAEAPKQAKTNVKPAPQMVKSENISNPVISKTSTSTTAEYTQTAALVSEFNALLAAPAIQPVVMEVVEPETPVEKADVEEVVKPKKTPKKAAAIKVKPKTATPIRTARKVRGTNYPVVTRQVQEDLTTMGYYRGELDGLQSVATQTAIKEFKTIFDLPVNNNITPELLTSLKRSIDDRKDAQALLEAIKVDEPLEEIKVADNSGDVYFFETPIEASADLAVATEEMTSAISEPVDSVDDLIVPPTEIETEDVLETEDVKVAALTDLPEEIVAPVVEDVIVPAKVTRGAKPEYPSRALRDRNSINAKVFVSYDVDAEGSVTNTKVTAIKFDTVEKYDRLFEKAAIRAVEQQRFEPRTVNGVAVAEEGRTTRISFNVE